MPVSITFCKRLFSQHFGKCLKSREKDTVENGIEAMLQQYLKLGLQDAMCQE